MKDAPGTIDAHVEADLARDYLGYTPVAIAIHLLAAVLMLLPLAPGAAGARWYACYVLLNGLRLLAWLGYRRADTACSAPQSWVDQQALGLLVSGIMWGLAPWMFFDGAPPVGRIYVFATIVVMAIGATVVDAPFRRARLAYCVPALGLGGVRAVLEGDTQFVTVGAVLLVSIPIVAYFGTHWARLLRESIRTRYEKTALVDELTAEKARAERANDAKSAFLAAASHDLRQPLHALSCYAALLDDPQRGAQVAPQVQACVRALGELFDGILDLARLDSGAIEPQRHDFALGDMMGRLQTLYQPLASDKGLRLRWRVDTPLTGHSDPVLVERIIGNLLGNAVRYTTAGGVLVAARARAGGVSILVRDTGHGMSDAELERAFDEFVQFDNPARNAALGYGLGLSTVRRLVDLLGHNLRVRSRTGRGTCFELRLPAGNSVFPSLDRPDMPAVAPVELVGRALVLDDHDASRDAIAALLVRWGLHCDAAANVADAERLRARHRYDAIFTDFRVPGGEDGLALAGRWRVQGPAPRLICVISGETGLPPELPVGVDWLRKPVRPVRLRALLTSRLGAGDGTGGQPGEQPADRSE